MGSEIKFASLSGPPKALICRICNQIMRDPVISLSCGHSFCKACTPSRVCPDHNIAIESTIVNDVLSSQIGDLMVFCP